MWIEESRRCDTDAEATLDVNPNEAVVFVAEMEGTLDGEKVFFTVCWAPFMPEFYAFELTRESMFAWLVDLNLDDNGALDRIRADALLRTEANENYDGEYSPQFHTLVRMINRRAEEVGYRTESYDSSDDLDDM